jgi:hypothetical protein
MKCPCYSFDINKPCSLEKCPNNIPAKEYKNCLSFYLLAKGSKPLKISEISSLFHIPKKDIDLKIKSIIDDIRISKLDGLINVGNEMEFVENSHRCVCCSKKADIEVGLNLNLHYCSEELVMIMQRLGVDARTVLMACVRCMSGKGISSLLEIDDFDLIYLYKHYFGVTISRLTKDNIECDSDFIDSTYKYEKLPKSSAVVLNDSSLIQDIIVASYC